MSYEIERHINIQQHSSVFGLTADCRASFTAASVQHIYYTHALKLTHTDQTTRLLNYGVLAFGRNLVIAMSLSRVNAQFCLTLAHAIMALVCMRILLGKKLGMYSFNMPVFTCLHTTYYIYNSIRANTDLIVITQQLDELPLVALQCKKGVRYSLRQSKL